VEKNKLITYDNQQRLIIQNGKWTPKEQSIMEIRRIKKDSYQYYLKYPDDQTRERYKKMGLSEGWKIYKRISNLRLKIILNLNSAVERFRHSKSAKIN
jgi:hypothetical protein